ncbi:MAG: hypothetical protein HOW73_02245 [Polyangiaceae bacterium]|nr:hypothetical protein [Polyangiaceae bacterium]
MLGLIVRGSRHTSTASAPIAGQPLLIRQLHYLRMLGATRMVVEYSADATLDEVTAWMRDEALTASVVLVPTVKPIGAHNLALHAGISLDTAVVALPEDVLADVDLRERIALLETGAPVSLALPSPIAELEGASLRIAKRIADLSLSTNRNEASSDPANGWAATITNLSGAMAIGTALLENRLPRNDKLLWPIQVHAAETKPGVFLARGARIEEGAIVHAPVFLGPGARIRAGAEVGPRAYIGEASVIERGATVRDAVVFDDTVVGEGICLEHIAANARGLVDLDTHEQFDVDDPALLAQRNATYRISITARLTALVLAFALAAPAFADRLFFCRSARPFERARIRVRNHSTAVFVAATGAKLFDFWLRLVDVVAARRALVGVRAGAVRDGSKSASGLELDASAAMPGALLVDAALAPLDATEADRLRARAWYGIAKSPRTDMTLVARSMRREQAAVVP